MPPVMARNPTLTLPQAEDKARRKTRRRYDVPIGGQGAEIRLPALPRVKVGWRLISFILLGLFSYGLYTVWNSIDFQVESAHINGLKRVSGEAVNAVLDVEGKPIFTLDAARMQKQLEDEFPEFSQVAVEVSLPNSVAVTVTERIPVLIWMQGDHTKLVDDHGMTFPLREDIANFPLPMVEANDNPPSPPAPPSEGELAGAEQGTSSSITAEGPNTATETAQPLLTQEMVDAILLLVKQAPQDAKISYSIEHGLAWTDKRGWNVYFGTSQNMEMKLLLYQSILGYLKTQDTRPEMISVEFLNSPYYRLASG
jgi:hypothetical protein